MKHGSNLRKRVVDDELYVNVSDLFKLMVDVMTMDSLHPEAIKALDGLGTGLALSLNVISAKDLSDFTSIATEGKTDAS